MKDALIKELQAECIKLASLIDKLEKDLLKKGELIDVCFNALERRHADDLVDELKDRYGMED